MITALFQQTITELKFAEALSARLNSHTRAHMRTRKHAHTHTTHTLTFAKLISFQSGTKNLMLAAFDGLLTLLYQLSNSNFIFGIQTVLK